MATNRTGPYRRPAGNQGVPRNGKPYFMDTTPFLQ
jgi:hypothetical protein